MCKEWKKRAWEKLRPCHHSHLCTQDRSWCEVGVNECQFWKVTELVRCRPPNPASDKCGGRGFPRMLDHPTSSSDEPLLTFGDAEFNEGIQICLKFIRTNLMIYLFSFIIYSQIILISNTPPLLLILFYLFISCHIVVIYSVWSKNTRLNLILFDLILKDITHILSNSRCWT